ncbi:MAG TPA: hypothetical protein VMI10_08815 [Terriglobales bacterium]|nr:hypothetical protein [Terriglobales bacterium]
MKWAMTISLCVLAVTVAVAQNPSVIQNTRAAVNGVQGNSPAPSSAAHATPAASTPASASVKPAAKSAQKPAKTATKNPKKAAKAEKTAAPKTEPTAEKKVGEIVGTPAPAAADGTAADQPAADKYSANGKRDPFISPVVAHASGSGCTTGKKCLEIGSINLRGVVHSDNGFIAVVSNSLNKAYFLRENDPVFNGYVVKITGDSIVFQETLQDRLGKTFTREVTKRITVPAV